ncbi:hypothetical protein C0Q70_04892 [Pomacea canaliculata]|uniref:Peptidase M12B domain-containing protein n=1 Tax=Pomacea canaliculata TaxID=400727 RepID=A0A2T7PJQ7_POMCA|nr:hypothetical protein C0Q70_04892 [Pomacea canaliculata]
MTTVELAQQKEKTLQFTPNSLPGPVLGGSPQWLEQEVDTERVLRRKRDSTKTEYYLDIIVALDYSFYKYWLNRANNVETTAVTNMKEYIAYIFNGINARYKSITTLPFNINILLRGYVIAKNASDSPWTEEIKETSSDRVQVNAITMLSRLQDYVKTKSNLPSCDHVVGFTDYDLFSDDSGFRFNNTAGFANVGAMCYPNGASVSVVEDHGGYQSETTATHELGHSLGALHDGNGNNCSSADRYIMSTGSQLENDANKYNPWHFSNCSIQYFQNFINKLIADK